jgi:hypothetical protein
MAKITNNSVHKMSATVQTVSVDESAGHSFGTGSEKGDISEVKDKNVDGQALRELTDHCSSRHATESDEGDELTVLTAPSEDRSGGSLYVFWL